MPVTQLCLLLLADGIDLSFQALPAVLEDQIRTEISHLAEQQTHILV